MNRKNYSNSGSRKNPRRGGPGGPGKPGQRSVSPMYKVDLLHHQLSGMTTPAPQRTGKPPVGQQPYRQQPPRQQEKKVFRPKAKKGYTNLNVEIKDEQYSKFLSRLKDESKSPKEVLNQLISFYNMGKINI